MIPYKHTPETQNDGAPCWHVYEIVTDSSLGPLIHILTGMNTYKVVCCWCDEKDELLDSWKPDVIPNHGPFAPKVTVIL